MSAEKNLTRSPSVSETTYCGVGSCDNPPGHNGIHRCRCGKPVDEPANGCGWHQSSAMREPKQYLYHPQNIIGEVRPGDDHSWAAEFKFLWTNDQHRMLELMASITKEGVCEPVVIGSDGRLWDGHHRLAVAIALQLGPIGVLDYRKLEGSL